MKLSLKVKKKKRQPAKRDLHLLVLKIEEKKFLTCYNASVEVTETQVNLDIILFVHYFIYGIHF